MLRLEHRLKRSERERGGGITCAARAPLKAHSTGCAAPALERAARTSRDDRLHVRRAVERVLVADRDEGGPRGRASGRVHQPRADVVDLGDHVGAILEVLRVTAVHMCGRCECEEPRMRGSASVGRCSSKCNSCAVQRGLRRRHSCCAMWTHRARVCVASTKTPARRQRRASTQEVGRTSRGNEITTMVVKS